MHRPQPNDRRQRFRRPGPSSPELPAVVESKPKKRTAKKARKKPTE